jgi:hypothetical protein
MSRAQREDLFHKCLREYESESYPSGWFLAPDVQRENIRDWLLWAVFTSTPDLALPEWEEELDYYIGKIEEKMGKKYQPGHNSKTKSIRIANDNVTMLHRPLIWYMVSSIRSYSPGLH